MTGEAATVTAKITALGFPVTAAEMSQSGRERRGKDHGRPGGRRTPTFAVGMAHMFAGASSQPGRPGPLVSLRHHVRGALHPDDPRCRDARRPVSRAGPAGARLPAPREHGFDPRQSRRHGPLRGRLGVVPLRRGGGPPRRDQFALADLRRRQPAPRRHRSGLRDDDPDQDGPDAPRLGHAAATRLAAVRHDDGGLDEDFLVESPPGLPEPAPRARPVSGSGESRRTRWRRKACAARSSTPKWTPQSPDSFSCWWPSWCWPTPGSGGSSSPAGAPRNCAKTLTSRPNPCARDGPRRPRRPGQSLSPEAWLRCEGGPRDQPGGGGRGVHGAGRPLGLRQVDDAPPDRRPGGNLRRPDDDRRAPGGQ